jgi:hypothetical protein
MLHLLEPSVDDRGPAIFLLHKGSTIFTKFMSHPRILSEFGYRFRQGGSILRRYCYAASMMSDQFSRFALA